MASTYRPMTAGETMGQHGTMTSGMASDFYMGVGRVCMMLRVLFTVVPIVVGLDKFFDILTNWDEYLAPAIVNILPITGHQFMMIVGVVEIAAGILVAIAPRFFGYLVMAWLWLVVFNLLLHTEYYDVALRDFGLSLGALTLARLSQMVHSHRPMSMEQVSMSHEAVHEYAEAPGP